MGLRQYNRSILNLCEVFLENVKNFRREDSSGIPRFNNRHDWVVEGYDNDEGPCEIETHWGATKRLSHVTPLYHLSLLTFNKRRAPSGSA